MYKDKLGSEDENTKQTGGTLETFGYKEFFMMDSSMKSNDCLIHTFLTATCPYFRQLHKQQKDDFADIFRRTVYAEEIFNTLIQAKQTIESKESFLARITSKAFLEDTDIINLCKYYNINILTFEDTKTSNGKTMPSCVTFNHVNASDETSYIIYNNGNHFEAVKTPQGYTISTMEAQQIETSHKCEFHEDQPTWKYQEFDPVRYRNKPYFVASRNINDKGLTYRLTDSLQDLQDFHDLPNAERIKLPNKQKFAPVEVHEENLVIDIPNSTKTNTRNNKTNKNNKNRNKNTKKTRKHLKRYA